MAFSYYDDLKKTKYFEAPINKNYGKAKGKYINYAFEFLFPESRRSPGLLIELENFVNKEFEQLGCVVLYIHNREFKAFLDRLGLSIGHKEIIITSSAIRATDDFNHSPKLVNF